VSCGIEWLSRDLIFDGDEDIARSLALLTLAQTSSMDISESGGVPGMKESSSSDEKELEDGGGCSFENCGVR
jgi:hypothetical protein